MAVDLVTKAIAELLRNKLNPQLKLNPPGAVTERVTTLPPDDERVEGVNGVNLFLYRVTESPFAKNNDWVGGRPDLRVIKRPPLSLTLQYMLTAYVQTPANDDIEAQRILSRAMLILHEFPVLNNIHDSDFDADLDAHFAPALRQAFDKIKITFAPISTDEFSKIWTGFSKAYRLSVAYEVSLLQIAPLTPTPAPAPPVQQIGLQVGTLGVPVISSVEPAIGPAGAEITLRGSGFRQPGRATVVTVGEAGAEEVEIRSLTDREIVLTLPQALERGPRVGLVVTTGGLASQPAFYEVQPWIQTLQPLRGLTGVPITIPLDVPAGATVGAEVDTLAAPATLDTARQVVEVSVPTVIATNGFKTVALIVNDGTPRRSNVRTYEVLPRIQSVTRTVNAGPPVKTVITVTGERLNGASVQVRYGKWLLKGTVVAGGASVTGEGEGALPADQPVSMIVDGHESSAFPPRLTSVEPAQAAVGELVTFTGSGLSGQSVAVRFGGVDLPARPQPFASRFSVAVPPGLAPGSLKVGVIVHSNITNELDFTVLA